MPHSYAATENYRSREPLIRNDFREILRKELESRFGKGPLIFHSVEMTMYVLERGDVQSSVAEFSTNFSTSISTVRRVLRRLKEVGWLRISRVCFDNGTQQANCYSVVGKALIELLRSQPSTSVELYSFVYRYLYLQSQHMNIPSGDSEEQKSIHAAEAQWDVVEQELIKEGFSRADEIVALLKKWAFDPEVIVKGIAINKTFVLACLAVA